MPTKSIWGIEEIVTELKKYILELAVEQNRTPLEIISELQAAAALVRDDELLDRLCELKWQYID